MQCGKNSKSVCSWSFCFVLGIDLSTQSLTFLDLPIDLQTMSLSLREKYPKHTEQMSKSHSQS